MLQVIPRCCLFWRASELTPPHFSRYVHKHHGLFFGRSKKKLKKKKLRNMHLGKKLRLKSCWSCIQTLQPATVLRVPIGQNGHILEHLQNSPVKRFFCWDFSSGRLALSAHCCEQGWLVVEKKRISLLEQGLFFLSKKKHFSARLKKTNSNPEGLSLRTGPIIEVSDGNAGILPKSLKLLTNSPGIFEQDTLKKNKGGLFA